MLDKEDIDEDDKPGKKGRALLDDKTDFNAKLLEDENEKKNRKMNRQSKQRFGFAIKFERYKTSNLIKIICITLAIIIIPLEIFVQNALQNVEIQLIINLQQTFGDSDAV